MSLLAQISLLLVAGVVAPIGAFPTHPSYRQTPLVPQDHTQDYEFDPLLHLPGISPYFDAVGFGLEHSAPEGCKVTSASYIIRHASIYANDDEYEEYIKPFLKKLDKHRDGKFTGPLEFFKDWQSPILEDRLEEITPAGHEDARKVGEHLLKRYPHLVPTVRRILTDKKSRTYDTAMSLVKGFPNSDDIEVVQIKKDTNGSMDALVPHKSCPAFNKKPGTKQMKKFMSVYAPKVAARFRAFIPFDLDDGDILGMQSLCGYESAIKGERSPICGIFSDAEWMAYEYAWDLRYAHMVGPMNKLSPYLGFPWLAAQVELFTNLEDESGNKDEGWPDGQRFFLSFTHREVPPFVATALGIFNSSSSTREQFPTDHVNWVRAWKMSDLIPFLGHVGMEKMHCDRPGVEGDYIRFIANSAPRPLPSCQSGPGASCPWEDFRKNINNGAEKHKDFHKVCGESPKR